jgi:hypothetical protein
VRVSTGRIAGSGQGPGLVHLVRRILCAWGSYLMRVGGLNRSAHHVAGGGGRFEEREEVEGKDDMVDMIHCYVSVDAVLGRLVGHDSSSRVQDQEIQAWVDLRGDLLGGIGGGRARSFYEGDFARVFRPGDVFECAVDDILRHAEYEEFGEVILLRRANTTPLPMPRYRR